MSSNRILAFGHRSTTLAVLMKTSQPTWEEHLADAEVANSRVLLAAAVVVVAYQLTCVKVWAEA